MILAAEYLVLLQDSSGLWIISELLNVVIYEVRSIVVVVNFNFFVLLIIPETASIRIIFHHNVTCTSNFTATDSILGGGRSSRTSLSQHPDLSI